MLHAAYGYILLYFFIAVLRYTADILLLGGAHRIISCRLYIQLNKPLSWILVGEIQILILVLLALYYVGSYVANEVLWLNVADPEIVDDLSNRKDKFEAAFFIIQFIFALFVFVGSLISAWKWRKYDKHIPKVNVILAQRCPKPSYDLGLLVLEASIFCHRRNRDSMGPVRLRAFRRHPLSPPTESWWRQR